MSIPLITPVGLARSPWRDGPPIRGIGGEMPQDIGADVGSSGNAVSVGLFFSEIISDGPPVGNDADVG